MSDTDSTDTLRAVVIHPLTGLLTALGLLMQVADVVVLEVAGAVVWTNAGTLFSMLSVMLTTIGASDALTAPGWLGSLVFVAGAVFVAKLLHRLVQSTRKRINDTN